MAIKYLNWRDNMNKIAVAEELMKIASVLVAGSPVAFDVVGKIIEYEEGSMNREEMVEFFQELINSGLVWQLQGSYGKTAEQLIRSGECHRKR